MVEKAWSAIGGRKFLGFMVASYLCMIGAISDVVWLISFIFFVIANVAQKVLLTKMSDLAVKLLGGGIVAK